MIKSILFTSMLLFFVSNLSAQKAELYFPKFAGSEYDFYIFRGNSQDTLSKGVIGEDGRTTLSLPDSLKNYRGMARWLLRKGGGLDIIFAGGENLSISSIVDYPSDKDIIYKNSAENDYLRDHYKKQQKIFAKVEALNTAIKTYDSSLSTEEKDIEGYPKELISTLKAELKKQEQMYNSLVHETTASKLYAARFSEIMNVINILPRDLSLPRESTRKQINDFIQNEMDMEALYTSGYWQDVLKQWLQEYTQNHNKNILLSKEYKVLLSRINSPKVKEALKQTIKELTQSRKNP